MRGLMRFFVGFILLLPATLCAQPAADPATLVERVESAYENLAYDDAEALARNALSRYEAFSPDQLIRLHTTLALVLYAGGEELEAAEEEEDHGQDELLARELRGHPRVEGDVPHQDEGLERGGIGLELGAALRENQGLPDRLEDVVGDEQGEDVEEHQDDAETLASSHVTEHTQRTVEDAGRREFPDVGEVLR